MMTQQSWTASALVALLVFGAGCGSSEVAVQSDVFRADGAPPPAPVTATPVVATPSVSEGPAATAITATASNAQSDAEVTHEEPSETESVSDISWLTIEEVYGLKSTVSNVDKQGRWKTMQGKVVEWTGTVGELSVQFGLPAIEVKMATSSDLPEVLLHVQKRSELAAQKLRKDDRFTFSGKLTSWGTVCPVVTLEDVRVWTQQDLVRRAEREKAAKIAAAEAAKANAEAAAIAAAREREAIESKQAEEDARHAKREHAASSKLQLARKQLDSGKKDIAKKWFIEIVNDYPDTEAGATAKKLLRVK